jgi:hypothetical protein
VRTTIDIHDPLLERAKRFAAKRGQNLADIVNDALTEKLGREEHPAAVTRPVKLPTFGAGGTQPGVDLHDNASIQSALDDVHRRDDGGLDLEHLR